MDAGHDDLHLCAQAERRFAELALGALGHRVESDGALWWTTAAVAPVFVQAGALRPPPPEAVVAVVTALPGRGVFRDTFACADLGPHGFTENTSETWMVRPPGPVAAPVVSGLTVARAATPDAVAVFERTTYANARALGQSVAGAVHPARATASIAGLHLLVGSVDGRPVATAIAVEGAGVLGVEAVTTHPAFRRRGIAAAMVARCCAVAPERPAALSATPAAVGAYRSLGFVPVGPAPHWYRY